MEILEAMGLGVAEELTGAAAMEHEGNMFDEDFMDGKITNVSDITASDAVANKYSHTIYKVIKSDEIRINDPSEWRSKIEPSLQGSGRFGGPHRRVPGRILQKNKQALYVSVYALITNDVSKHRSKRKLPRGKIQYIFNIYAVTED